MRCALLAIGLFVVACNSGPKAEPTPDPTTPAPAATTTAKTDSALHLGAAIDSSAPTVSLADVAKAPASYADKTVVTTGTVTAVCQHMGCWMEIKDDASQAHIKMAGHKFFVPKTASGRKARVMAKLVPSDAKEGACEADGEPGMAASEAHEGKKGCRAEAEQQMGHPLAKLELEAAGVELM